MIGLDTNVLVRLLTRDDEEQAEKARTLLEEHAEEDRALFVSDVVLAELAWTLDRAYGLEKAEIANAIKALAGNATLAFESREVIRSAQELFSQSSAGFADCLILAKAMSQGCASLATFDKAMRGLAGSVLL